MDGPHRAGLSPPGVLWTDPLPHPLQDKRLSTESGLSEDSQPSTGTASQGEPEGSLADTQGLSQQEAAPNAQEEAVEEETYEEVRLAPEAKQMCRWDPPVCGWASRWALPAGAWPGLRPPCPFPQVPLQALSRP